jgi:oligopeptide/dipeptide ABC transporter ATP-binding protein
VRYMADEIVVMYLGKIVEHAPTRLLFDDARHPYTKALLSAVLPPRIDRGEEEIVLTGEIPSPLNPPAGCRFHTRCPFAMRRCTQEEPLLRETTPRHFVACHLEVLK